MKPNVSWYVIYNEIKKYLYQISGVLYASSHIYDGVWLRVYDGTTCFYVCRMACPRSVSWAIYLTTSSVVNAFFICVHSWVRGFPQNIVTHTSFLVIASFLSFVVEFRFPFHPLVSSPPQQTPISLGLVVVNINSFLYSKRFTVT